MKYISRKDLLNVVSQIENYRDKFLVLGLFEGIGGHGYLDIANSRISQITGNIIHTNSNMYIDISDELIDIANKASKMYYYYTESSVRKLVDVKYNDEIYKMFPNAWTRSEESTSKRMMQTLSVNIKKLMPEYSIKDIRESGKLYYIKKELDYLRITIDEYCENPNRYIIHAFDIFTNKKDFKDLKERYDYFVTTIDK